MHSIEAEVVGSTAAVVAAFMGAVASQAVRTAVFPVAVLTAVVAFLEAVVSIIVPAVGRTVVAAGHTAVAVAIQGRKARILHQELVQYQGRNRSVVTSGLMWAATDTALPHVRIVAGAV